MKLIGTVLFVPYQQQAKMLLIASLEKAFNVIIPAAAEAERGRQSTSKVPSIHILLGIPLNTTVSNLSKCFPELSATNSPLSTSQRGKQ